MSDNESGKCSECGEVHNDDMKFADLFVDEFLTKHITGKGMTPGEMNALAGAFIQSAIMLQSKIETSMEIMERFTRSLAAYHYTTRIHALERIALNIPDSPPSESAELKKSGTNVH